MNPSPPVFLLTGGRGSSPGLPLTGRWASLFLPGLLYPAFLLGFRHSLGNHGIVVFHAAGRLDLIGPVLVDHIVRPIGPAGFPPRRLGTRFLFHRCSPPRKVYPKILPLIRAEYKKSSERRSIRRPLWQLFRFVNPAAGFVRGYTPAPSDRPDQ